MNKVHVILALLLSWLLSGGLLPAKAESDLMRVISAEPQPARWLYHSAEKTTHVPAHKLQAALEKARRDGLKDPRQVEGSTWLLIDEDVANRQRALHNKRRYSFLLQLTAAGVSNWYVVDDQHRVKFITPADAWWDSGS